MFLFSQKYQTTVPEYCTPELGWTENFIVKNKSYIIDSNVIIDSSVKANVKEHYLGVDKFVINQNVFIDFLLASVL